LATKSKQKQETVKFVSPFGIARFPKLNKPDTDGQYADGKFKTVLVLEDADVDGVHKVMVAAAKQLLPNVPVDEVALPLKELFDKDQNDKTKKTSIGYGFQAKSKRRPLVIDAKKNRMAESTIIGGGSVIRIGGALAAYAKSAEQIVVVDGKRTKEKVTEYGLTVYLNSVQVKSLSQGGGHSDGSEFDEVERYEYEADFGSEETVDATEL
jgi:hypothetical protein